MFQLLEHEGSHVTAPRYDDVCNLLKRRVGSHEISKLKQHDHHNLWAARYDHIERHPVHIAESQLWRMTTDESRYEIVHCDLSLRTSGVRDLPLRPTHSEDLDTVTRPVMATPDAFAHSAGSYPPPRHAYVVLAQPAATPGTESQPICNAILKPPQPSASLEQAPAPPAPSP